MKIQRQTQLILAAILSALTISVSLRAEVITSDVCNQDRVIIETIDHWYATAVYIDGYMLKKGDRLQNNEVALQSENKLTLADGTQSGNYFITSIRETFAEASADACQ